MARIAQQQRYGSVFLQLQICLGCYNRGIFAVVQPAVETPSHISAAAQFELYLSKFSLKPRGTGKEDPRKLAEIRAMIVIDCGHFVFFKSHFLTFLYKKNISRAITLIEIWAQGVPIARLFSDARLFEPSHAGHPSHATSIAR